MKRFEIGKKYIAGLRLTATQVKAIATAQYDVKNGYFDLPSLTIKGIFVKDLKLQNQKHDENAPIPVLLNKYEIQQLKGEHVIVLDFFQKNGKYKATLATATRVKTIDKRRKLLEKAEKDEWKRR